MVPFGLEPSGLVGFAAVKLGGYTLAGLYLNRKYRANTNPLLFGAVRTAVGVVAGIGIAATLDSLGLMGSGALYLALLPVRLAVWYFLIDAFYERRRTKRPRQAGGYAALGTLWSYCLDVPAMWAIALAS